MKSFKKVLVVTMAALMLITSACSKPNKRSHDRDDDDDDKWRVPVEETVVMTTAAMPAETTTEWSDESTFAQTAVVTAEDVTSLTAEEITQLVVEHYNNYFDTTVMTAFDTETSLWQNGYLVILRSTGGNDANVLYSYVYCDVYADDCWDDFGHHFSLSELMN